MAGTTVVTGAAGGIGSAVCRRLRRDGHHVIGLDRDRAEAADDVFVVDLADAEALAECGTALGREYAVTSLVHCAAVQPLGGAGDTSVRAWLATVQVNVIATDMLVGALHKSLVEHQGSVVVISSVHGRATTSGITTYATTKAALEGWVRAAALDLAPDVRVNAVVPGAIDTAKLREGFARWGDEDAGARMQVLRDRTPLRRIGAPEDVAAAVSFLSGDGARFITGTALTVDGGATLRLGSE